MKAGFPTNIGLLAEPGFPRVTGPLLSEFGFLLRPSSIGPCRPTKKWVTNDSGLCSPTLQCSPVTL